MFRIRQTFECPIVRDVAEAVRFELKKLSLEKCVKSGERVAITAGSRGIANIAEILKALIEFLKSLGAQPFIFPAMGSHGGATAEGQVGLLSHYGISEISMRAPIFSSMEVMEIGKTEDGVPVYIDRHASQADHIVVVNRIKPHTKFKAPIESGLMKMMAIGMGKQIGADYYHKAALHYTFFKIIVDAGRIVIKKAPILCGLGIIENSYDETAKIMVLRPDEIETEEETLLSEAKRMMPRLPFNEIDLLIVDEIGKDISGVGIDPNVTGRNKDLLGVFSHPTNTKRIFVRDLTAGSNGNAIGIGLADITTKRLVDKIDYQATYINAITGISLEKAAVPMYFETDRKAIEVALGSIGLTPPEKSRIIRIKNTLHLDEVEVSEVYEKEILQRSDLEMLEGPTPMVFDENGNLRDMQVQGVRKGDI
ncbi:MAG TPA: lactate racemase domain-containing protein [Thermodesulfobacteriota bacterium]|nr:lactate racemase domain-containing protein [Thermodesulfobacteriota bacterium]